jgi:hypothetical protein
VCCPASPSRHRPQVSRGPVPFPPPDPISPAAVDIRRSSGIPPVVVLVATLEATTASSQGLQLRDLSRVLVRDWHVSCTAMSL